MASGGARIGAIIGDTPQDMIGDTPQDRGVIASELGFLCIHFLGRPRWELYAYKVYTRTVV